MSIDPLNIGLTGLEAFQTQVDVAANNIANVATPGFQAEDTQFGELLTGGVKARIVASQTPQPASLPPTGIAGSNVDLAANIISLIEGQEGFEANARSIVTGDEMLGTIINDIK